MLLLIQVHCWLVWMAPEIQKAKMFPIEVTSFKLLPTPIHHCHIKEREKDLSSWWEKTPRQTRWHLGFSNWFGRKCSRLLLAVSLNVLLDLDFVRWTTATVPTILVVGCGKRSGKRRENGDNAPEFYQFCCRKSNLCHQSRPSMKKLNMVLMCVPNVTKKS